MYGGIAIRGSASVPEPKSENACFVLVSNAYVSNAYVGDSLQFGGAVKFRPALMKTSSSCLTEFIRRSFAPTAHDDDEQIWKFVRRLRARKAKGNR